MKKNLLRMITTTAVSVLLLGASSLFAQADSSIWESTTSRDANGNICIDFEEVQVLLPSDWSGNCQMSTSDSSVSFYQIKSRELWTQKLGYANGGFLFSINCSSSYDFLDDPSYQMIGIGSEGIYYATFPTDLQGYTEDAEAIEEFQRMSSDMEWVKKHITLTSEESSYAVSGEYIFPGSSTSYLSESDLSSLDAAQIQMAINEIYARHHRKFVLQDVQDYFNSKSWYSGTIEADDFDPSILNEYESANINLMVTFMNKLQKGQNTTVVQ